MKAEMNFDNLGDSGIELSAYTNNTNLYNLTWSANNHLIIPTKKKARGVVISIKDGNYWMAYTSVDDDCKMWRCDTNGYWVSDGNQVYATFSDNQIEINGSYTGANKTVAVVVIY